MQLVTARYLHQPWAWRGKRREQCWNPEVRAVWEDRQDRSWDPRPGPQPVCRDPAGDEAWGFWTPNSLFSFLPCSLPPVSCSCFSRPEGQRGHWRDLCRPAQGGEESGCGETNERCLVQGRLCGGSGEGLLPRTTLAEAQSICGSS